MSQQSNRTIVVVGNRAVGKSAIVHQLAEEKHDFDVYRPTIDDCYNITWKLPDGQYLPIQMIDTAAWNEFPAMQTLYIKMAQLVLIVYDVVSPTWKESLIRIINGVRNVKPDADIFIVGNKCDRLKTSDRFTPSDLSKLIGHTCVGHVYTSAINQQGIVGLKQMILRSKSQLTAGHYQEFSTIHKRKKIKQKLGGLALLLNIAKKEKANQVPEAKYREPIIYPRQTRSPMQYSDLTQGNFDKLFDAASEEQLDNMSDRHPVTYRRRCNGRNKQQNGETNPRDCVKSCIDPGFTSDYSSPGASPSSYFEFFGNSMERKPGGKRRSIDFSQLTLDLTSDGDSYSSWSRLRAQKKMVDSTPSNCTVSSDSSTDSLSPDNDRSTLRVTLRSSLPPANSIAHRRSRRSSALVHSSSLDGDILLRSDDSGSTRSRTSSLTILDDVINEDDVEITTALANMRLKERNSKVDDIRSSKAKPIKSHHVRYRSESGLLSESCPPFVSR